MTGDTGNGGGSGAPGPDSAQVRYAIDQLRSQQNLLLGALAGAGAAVVGAVLWAAITVVTGVQIGFMAIGVGLLVGFAVRVAGRGIESSFGVVGGLLSLVGCALGNLLAASAVLADQQGVSVWAVLGGLDLELAQALMTVFFSPMDLLFYGIAVYEGYQIGFRTPAPEELEAFGVTRAGPPSE